jgi:hypothetical protein
LAPFRALGGTYTLTANASLLLPPPVRPTHALVHCHYALGSLLTYLDATESSVIELRVLERNITPAGVYGCLSLEASPDLLRAASGSEETES